MRLGIGLGLGLLIAGSLAGQELPAHWQIQRDYVNRLYEEACNGDQRSNQELRAAALEDANPAALNNWSVLLQSRQQESCAAFGLLAADVEIRETMEQAAVAGYPIAMDNWGNMLLVGSFGVAQDIPQGISWLEQSVRADWAGAAEQLAFIFVNGIHEQRQNLPLSRVFADQAEALGLPENSLAELRRAIEAAEQN